MATRPPLYFTTPKLLTILQMGGASGRLFTVDQVISYLGKYIDMFKLYDPVNKRIINCKGNLLGEVFEVDQFVVSDFKNLWKYLSPCMRLASRRAASPKRTGPVEDEPGPSSSSALPWWYVNKDKPEEGAHSRTTGKDSYADRETIVVQDTEYEDSDHGECDYGVEFEPVSEPDTDITDVVSSDEEDTLILSEIESLQHLQKDDDDSDGTSDVSVDPEVDIALKERWRCGVCKLKNSFAVGYCQRCWKPRKGWWQRKSPELRMSDPCSSSAGEDQKMGFDVADGGTSMRSLSSNVSSSSTIKPSLPSFASPLKHKLEEDESSEMETEPKKLHLDEAESSLGSSLSTSTSQSSSSNDLSSFPGLCNICNNKPNDAVMVHSTTGHQFSCYTCSKRLKKRGKPCPVCRQPIMLVLKNFIVN